jgi:hypothetical protein
MSEPSVPPAGWYPAPHASNERRYWDGARWLDHPAAPQSPAPAVSLSGAADKPKRRLKWGHWLLIVVAALVVIGGIGTALSGGNRATGSPPASAHSSSPQPAGEEPAAEPEPEPDPEPVMVDVPDLVGLTAAEAVDELRDLGLEPELNNEDDADVTGSRPAAGVSVEKGSTVVILAKDRPTLSLGQENAVKKALSYLDFTAFSRKGLIDQLEYEGFSTKEAAFAVDYIDVDWNEQAALKAQDYLDFSSFSRQGLIDQLVYEGFTEKQAKHGVKEVGF